MKCFFIAMLFIVILTTVSDAGNLSFCWDANQDVVSGYRLFMKIGGNGPYSLVWEGTSTCSELSDSILKRGEVYLFVVRAFNDYGESIDSNMIWYITSEDFNTMGNGGNCWIRLLFGK